MSKMELTIEEIVCAYSGKVGCISITRIEETENGIRVCVIKNDSKYQTIDFARKDSSGGEQEFFSALKKLKEACEYLEFWYTH